MQNDSEIAQQLNEFFKNAVSTLGITENSFIINKEYENISDPVQRAIVKFESHPSISLIKNKITNGNNFKFEPVSLSDIELAIRILNPKKATTHKNIPPKILKSSSEPIVNVLHKLFNETITKGVFPNNLKLADVTPVFKKDDPFDKRNYRPVPVGTRRKMNVFCTFKIGPFVPIKKGRLLDVLKIIFIFHLNVLQLRFKFMRKIVIFLLSMKHFSFMI